MENNKKVKSFGQFNENLNTTDIMELLSEDEMKMVEKGKKHWTMDILNKRPGGYIRNTTTKELIDKVIENTWVQAKSFYEGGRKDEMNIPDVGGNFSFEDLGNFVIWVKDNYSDEIVGAFAERNSSGKLYWDEQVGELVKIWYENYR